MTQRVYAAMHVRVILSLVASNSVDNRSWLLRRGGAIEVNKRVSIDFLIKCGEVATTVCNVGHRCLKRLAHDA